MATHVTRCFYCGGTNREPKEVEEFLSVDDYAVRCKVPATVCLRCGERYFDPDTVRRFEKIRAHVRTDDLSGL
jgi:YgiT-type zinc finger domain-containing protein